MGALDGLDGDSEAGSTAEVAKRLGPACPPRGGRLGSGAERRGRRFSARSASTRGSLAGVILNRVGGERHVKLAPRRPRAGVRDPGLRRAGVGGRDSAARAPPGSRHRDGGTILLDLFERLADVAESSVDLDACLALATSTVEPSVPPTPGRPTMRLGLAQDEAFQFYYADSLDALARAGAENRAVEPSPRPGATRRGRPLPGRRLSEVHAGRLAANRTAREAVRAFARDGRPVYPRSVAAHVPGGGARGSGKGAFHAMAGRAARAGADGAPRLTIGYRESGSRATARSGRRGRCSAATSSIAPTWSPRRAAGPRQRRRIE